MVEQPSKFSQLKAGEVLLLETLHFSIKFLSCNLQQIPSVS